MLAPRTILILLLLAGILPLTAPSGRAMDIVALGSWSETVDFNDLVGGAGGTLTGTYESALDQASLSIQNTAAVDDSWRVDVRRLDTNWLPDCSLSLRRTSDGTGGGGIFGGASYQIIGTTDAAFFSGAGDRDGVDLQLRLEGLSIQVSPDTYSTTIIYTLVDT